MKESTNEASLSTEIILDNKEFDEDKDNILREKENQNDVHEEMQVEQDKVNMSLLNLKLSLTKAADVLRTTDIKDSDNYQLVKIQIRVRAVYLYKWVVLHRPIDIKNNFKAILEELKKKSIQIDEETEGIFSNIQSLQIEFIEEKLKKIEDYYRELFKSDKIKNTLALKEFFGIGLGSFNQYNNGNKPFEGYALKREEPYCLKNILSKIGPCLECLVYKYQKKWIIVKDDSIYYSDKSDSAKGNNVYFFTDSMKIIRSKKKLLIISGAGPDLILKFSSFYERELWCNEITLRMEKLKSIIDHNLYGAYTNEKLNNKAYWFVDGKDYYLDLKEKLEAAKETIFITDWWMSPEVWLERPIDSQAYMALEFQKKERKEVPPYTRLKDILYQLAIKGIKIYILVYQECSYALTLDSLHTQNSLEKLHPNIIVTRHPSGISDLLWSHHEKLVIIDQIIAYVGGLDLCWGRWDTHEHPLVEEPNSEQRYYWPGIDYANNRINDFSKVKEYLKENVDRTQKPRMPWHDVHCRLIGPVVYDIARHFVQRWNISRGDSITDIKQNASAGQKKRRGLKEKEEEDYIRPEKKDDNFIINIIDKEEKDKKKKKEEVNIKKKDKTVIKKKDKKEKEEDKEEDKEEEKEEEKKEEINIKKSEKTVIKKKEKKDEEEEEKDENKEEINIKKTGKTAIKRKTKKDKESEEESKEEETKEESEDKENKKDTGIVLLDKGKKKLIKRGKKKEEIQNEDEDEVEDNEKIEIPDIKFNYNELRKKNIENYEVVDENHFYRSRPKLRGMLNMKEIREMFNINVANQDNKINVQDYQDSERGGFYNSFVKNVGKAESEKIIGKSYISKVIENSQKQTLIQNVNQNFFDVGTKSTVQVLRSVCDWCTGMDQVENSILKAYYRLIENSKHYIFIENQFFVSKSYTKEEEDSEAGKNSISSIVKNEIALRIRKRIERAYLNKEKFRVYIFIPLLPGFAGDPDEGTIQIILGHTYAGICRNNGLSIIEELKSIMGDKWKNYIGFYSLRGHDVLNGVPVTELIYIHSKLMIVDDESVIIGSANINDRSMLGSRDSEFCVLINETMKFDSIMDGNAYKSAKFAVTLRKALMSEHLGVDVDDERLIDPVSDELLKLFMNTAKKNTLTYRKLFRCYPDDEMKTFKDTKKCPKIPFTDKKEIEQLQKDYEKEKKSIKGHIVEFPLHFLEKEVLGAGFLGIYSLVPEHNFT